MPENLPQGYYHRNFTYLLEFVAERYHAILNTEELSFLQDFQHLSRTAQRLYVRLYSRKGPLFRTDKLSYEDIPDITEAAQELISGAFLNQEQDGESEQILSLLLKDELIVLAGCPCAAMKKHEILALVAESMSREALIDAIPFEILRPCRLNTLKTYRLLFFGNLHQDMTDFVLHELGVTPFETYEVDAYAQCFSNRQALDEALTLYDLGEQAGVAIENNDEDALLSLMTLLPSRNSDFPGLGFRHDRLINNIARQLERHGYLNEAALLYRQSKSPPARERIARILAKQDDKDTAIAICQKIVAEPIDEAEYEFAIKFMSRQMKKNDPARTALPTLATNFKTLELCLKQQDMRVEALVCQWAEDQGNTAFYVENGLLPGLFGLAFWDVIFLPVDGVFFNPYQRGPIDLFLTTFSQVRAQHIEERFETLARPGVLQQIVAANYQCKYGKANYFVFWEMLSPELIHLALSSIPASDLLAVFRRLLIDLRNNRSGFPDLILFQQGSYQLVEVKGPGDRLQINQERWFRFFTQNNMPASIANVSFQ
jgi:hypothetical protein